MRQNSLEPVNTLELGIEVTDRVVGCKLLNVCEENVTGFAESPGTEFERIGLGVVERDLSRRSTVRRYLQLAQTANQ